MTQDFEDTQSQHDQLAKLKEDLARLHQELNELRTRLARLEEERAEKAAESLETSF